MIPPDHVERKLDGVVDNVPPHEGCECLMESLLMNNEIQMAMKILLIVMMPTFC